MKPRSTSCALPPLTPDFLFQSKGGILSKACDYITELRQRNQRLADDLREMDRLQTDNQLYRQQVAWS